MTDRLAEVYDALRSLPGMDQAKARRAAEALGSDENRFAGIESRLDRLDERLASFDDATNQRFNRLEERLTRLEEKVDRLDARLMAVETNVSTMKWMMGFLLAGVAAIVLKLFV